MFKSLLAILPALLGTTLALDMHTIPRAMARAALKKHPMVMEYQYNDMYDPEFWEGFDEEEEPFEHDWTDIPDFVNMTNLEWYFNVTHHFLTGFERGMYMDDTIVLNVDCFGTKYVERTNWLAAMIHDDPIDNWIQELAVAYQLYYMAAEKCKIDHTIADILTFCWNEECKWEDIYEHTEANFLYMTRALIDAAIVWQEGVPEEEWVELDQWHELSR